MFTNGENQIVYIAIDEVYIPVGCLTGNSLSETSDFIGTTTRDNEGWKTSIPTNQSYTLSFSGVSTSTIGTGGDATKASYDRLVALKRARTLLNFRISTSGGNYVTLGKAYIETIGETANVGELITFEVSMVGYGTLINETTEETTWDSTAVSFDNTLINF